jgi:transcriptional regulator with XRE-family HTH domain
MYYPLLVGTLKMVREIINLRSVRKAKDLTLVKLGKLAGTSKQNIWNLENGFSKGSLHVWDKLEAILGVDQKILRQVEKAK